MDEAGKAFPKIRRLCFTFNRINGRDLEKGPKLYGWQVNAILSDHKGLRKTESDKSWEWRVNWAGSDPAPRPVEGETWEMMGVETGSFDAYSQDAWREIGSPTEQMAPWHGRFATRFEFIAVRKIQ